MHEIRDIIIIFLVSLPIIFLFKKLNLPSIVGFLVAGIIIGPYGFKLITETENIKALAEIGVILLLFSIGLEVSFGRLMKMKKFLLVAGGLQVLLTIILAAVLFYATGIGITSSIFFGMLISLSSTAIVLRVLSERNEVDAPQGKIALSILVFQDLAIVPMMLFLPILGMGEDVSIFGIIFKLLVAIAFLAGIIVISRYLMPGLLFQLANLRIREAFIIGIILLILGTAYLTEMIGLSLALGAFIAGLILSETDFTHQIVAEIIPFKDAFNSLFFVSIGLLLNYNFVTENPLFVILLTTGIVIPKALVIFLIVVFMKYPARIALITALSLAQIGEFSFVLSGAGMEYKLIESQYYNAFLAGSIITMLITPFLIQLAPHLAARLKFSLFSENMLADSSSKLKDHVIIAGFGLNGRNVARVLKETGIKYIILDINPERIREYKAKKENIIYGDVTRKDVLQDAGIDKASIIVLAISDPASTRIGIRLVKDLNPSIYTIVRAHFINEIDELKKLGADEIIPEEFETSLQIFSKVLEKYHIPINIIMKQVNIIRAESYEMLRKEPEDVHILSHIDRILAEGVTETYFVEETNPNANKTLTELNIRAKTGATIIALMRDGKNITNPSGNECIKPNDTLVLYGTHLAVDKAINLLSTPQ